MGFTILALTEFVAWAEGQLRVLSHLDSINSTHTEYRERSRQSITLQMEQASAAKAAKEVAA